MGIRSREDSVPLGFSSWGIQLKFARWGFRPVGRLLLRRREGYVGRFLRQDLYFRHVAEQLRL